MHAMMERHITQVLVREEMELLVRMDGCIVCVVCFVSVCVSPGPLKVSRGMATVKG